MYVHASPRGWSVAPERVDIDPTRPGVASRTDQPRVTYPSARHRADEECKLEEGDSRSNTAHNQNSEQTLPQPSTAAMASTEAINYITTDGFPAPGLRKTQRLITGHNAEGKGVFLATDHGDHHRIMGEGQAVANILYSTKENPVDLNGDLDVAWAKENEVCTYVSYVLCLRLRLSPAFIPTDSGSTNPASPASTSPTAPWCASSTSDRTWNPRYTAPCPSTTASSSRASSC